MYIIDNNASCCPQATSDRLWAAVPLLIYLLVSLILRATAWGCNWGPYLGCNYFGWHRADSGDAMVTHRGALSWPGLGLFSR